MIFYYLLFIFLFDFELGDCLLYYCDLEFFFFFILNKWLIFFDLGKVKKIYMCWLEIILVCFYLDIFVFS